MGRSTCGVTLQPRAKTVGRIADHLVAQHPGDTLHVAVDGLIATGRSTLAGELAEAVEVRGRPAIRLSMDGSHYTAALLAALGPADAVLIVDGTLRNGADLAGLWDEVIFIDTSESVDASEQAYEVDPVAQAGIVLSIDDPAFPSLKRIGGRADAQVRLFSYGTLQLPAVQMANFGRHLDGTADALTSHRTDWVTIIDPDVVAASGADRHPIVRPTATPSDRVTGTVFTVSPAELAAADGYEVDDYRRTIVRLASGVDSWVYLAAEAPLG